MPPIHPRTLVDLLDQRQALTPGAAAFVWDDGPVSYETVWRHARRFAGRLLDLGVARGDRVIVRLPNGPDFFTAFYGSMAAGAIAVPVFPASGAERLATLARSCGATIVVGPGDGRDPPGLRALSVADGLRGAEPASLPVVGPDDVAFLQYTSGSTGSPKGVMLTHAGLVANIGQLVAGMGLTPADWFVSWLPVFHDMGLILMTMVPFALGATLVLLPTAVANARPWLVAIARHGGTVTAAPDFAYRLTLRHVKNPSAYDLGSLRLALDAAEPVRPGTIEAFERAFGLDRVVVAGYGLAEATVGVCTWPAGTAPLVDDRGVVSVGRPFPGIDIQIIENDRPLPAGRTGEIAVASPANTRGYFSDPEETARLFWRDRYIRTGDLGYVDEAGRLFVTGRLKNIIKHAGETIFPQEAEQIVDGLAPVRRSAAVGIDSGGPEGEQLYVFAELARPGGSGEAGLRDLAIDIVQAVHAQLGLRPGRVYLLRPRAIPITPNGKTRHVALRAQSLSGDLRERQAILFPDY